MYIYSTRDSNSVYTYYVRDLSQRLRAFLWQGLGSNSLLPYVKEKRLVWDECPGQRSVFSNLSSSVQVFSIAPICQAFRRPYEIGEKRLPKTPFWGRFWSLLIMLFGTLKPLSKPAPNRPFYTNFIWSWQIVTQKLPPE